MAIAAPINHIEIQEHNGSAVIAGTGLKVHVIAPMYVNGYASAEWIIENYELTPAQFYAAVSYYFDHRAEIDAKLREFEEYLKEHGVSSDELLARLKQKQQTESNTKKE